MKVEKISTNKVPNRPFKCCVSYISQGESLALENCADPRMLVEIAQFFRFTIAGGYYSELLEVICFLTQYA